MNIVSGKTRWLWCVIMSCLFTSALLGMNACTRLYFHLLCSVWMLTHPHHMWLLAWQGCDFAVSHSWTNSEVSVFVPLCVGFDRVEEAIGEMEKLDIVWEKVEAMIEERLAKKAQGSATRVVKPQMGEYQVPGSYMGDVLSKKCTLYMRIILPSFYRKQSSHMHSWLFALERCKGCHLRLIYHHVVQVPQVVISDAPVNIPLYQRKTTVQRTGEQSPSPTVECTFVTDPCSCEHPRSAAHKE